MDTFFDFENFVSAAIVNGGATQHYSTSETPDFGYMVSLHPEAELRVNTLTPYGLLRWCERFADLLHEPQHYVGVWFDSVSQKWVLDVSTNVSDITRAEQLGKLARQQAIWDIANSAEIRL